MFSELLRQLSSHGFSGRIAGGLAVSSGDVGVGNKLFPRCSCLGVSAKGVAYQCKDCGRDFGNYFWFQSGDGSGNFPVIEIRSRSSELVGVLVVFDSLLSSKPTLQEQILRENASPYEDFDLQKLKRFGDLKTLDFGQVKNTGNLYISDVRDHNLENPSIYSLAKVNSLNLGVYAFCEPMGRSDDKRKDNPMKVPEPLAPRPRILVVFSPPASDQLKLQGQYLIDDWPKHILLWRTSLIDSVEFSEAPTKSEDEKAASTPGAQTSEAAPCTDCGAILPGPPTKFCAMCGSKR
jgi:hypothetical protein